MAALPKYFFMRTLALLFIIAGIYFLVSDRFVFRDSRTVNNYGVARTYQTDEKILAWPWYAGPVAILTGIVLLVIRAQKED